MTRGLAGYFFVLLLTFGGCVVYDPYPGYYNYPGYQYPRHHYRGPPVDFRFHYYRGWHGLYQDATNPAFQLGYWDAPLMCADPKYIGGASKG
jgi:hypothetical protein